MNEIKPISQKFTLIIDEQKNFLYISTFLINKLNEYMLL